MSTENIETNEEETLPERKFTEDERVYLDTDTLHKLKVGIKYDDIDATMTKYLLKETVFVVEDNQPVPKELSYEEMRLVGIGKMRCPICRGSGEESVKHKGRTTKVLVWLPILCVCDAYQKFFSRWENPTIVPANYRSISLENVREEYGYRMKNFTTDQAKFLFDTIEEYPQGSYLMTGWGGTGKSTLMMALYQGALQRWAIQSFERGDSIPAVWKISALQLSKQFKNWELRHMEDRAENDPVELPMVTVNRVKAAMRAGYQPCLFLEELDKYKLDSKFQNSEFFNIIELIHSNGGQLVATSNLSEMALRTRVTEQYSVTRRFIDKPFGVLLDFNEGTIERAVDKSDEPTKQNEANTTAVDPPQSKEEERARRVAAQAEINARANEQARALAEQANRKRDAKAKGQGQRSPQPALIVEENLPSGGQQKRSVTYEFCPPQRR